MNRPGIPGGSIAWKGRRWSHGRQQRNPPVPAALPARAAGPCGPHGPGDLRADRHPHRGDHPDRPGSLEIGTESLRSWVRQAEVDGGLRPGTSTQRQRAHRGAGARGPGARRTNEILRTASAFFAAELDGRRPDDPLHRRPTATGSGSSRSAVRCRSPRPATTPPGASRRRPGPARRRARPQILKVYQRQLPGLRRPQALEAAATARAMVGRLPVARLMGTLGMRRRGARQARRTTVPDRRGRGRRPGPAPLHRLRPDRLWVADITYVRTWAGLVYLAAVLDVFSRRWSAGMARPPADRAGARRPRAWPLATAPGAASAGLVHHSDRGLPRRIQLVVATP